MLSVEVEGEGQRLLALYQKAGAAYGGGFRNKAALSYQLGHIQGVFHLSA